MITKKSDNVLGSVWAQVLVFLAAAAYLYVNLFAFPNIPIYLNGDQTFFWEYALRMLAGERIYRDFFQFTPPGTDLFFLGLFKLFGPRIWVMNFAVLLLGAALCWICFSIAKLLMKRKMALLTTCLFLVVIYGRLLDATHHWFGLLASLCAVRMVVPARTALRVAAAGALFAVASCFTQTAGVAGVLALLLTLLWEGLIGRSSHKRGLAAPILLLAVFVLVLAAFGVPLIAEVGGRQLWYFLFTYPHSYLTFKQEGLFQGQFDLQGVRDFARRGFLPLLLVTIYLRVLWGCWRKRNESEGEDTSPLVLLALLGLFLLLSIVSRSNWTRIFAVSMPGLILLVRAAGRSSRMRAPFIVAGVALVGCLAAGQTWAVHRDNAKVADLPAGRAALTEQKHEKFSWFAQHTKPGDFMFQEGWLNLYPALELRSPAFVDGLWANEVTRPEYVDLTIQQLESTKPKYILITPGLNTPDDPSRPWQDHLGPFLAYLKSHYDFVRSFSDKDEVWQRH